MVPMTEVKRKVCLIGDGGVGKTSLIRRFVFDQFDDKYLATFGTKVTKKSIEIHKDEDTEYKLNLLIWDVMGQDEFKKAQAYAYNGTHAALIVCDITRKETLSRIKSWSKDLFKVTKKVPIIILANKKDLKNEAEFTPKELQKVSEEIEASFFVTSAKTGENVEEAFLKLGSKLV